MPKFTVSHKTAMNQQEAFGKIKNYFETSDDFKKFDPNMTCQFDASKFSGVAKGSQFECALRVEGNGPSEVILDVSIPFLLSPFKGKITETLERRLNKLFA
jgi:hypothetical protein